MTTAARMDDAGHAVASLAGLLDQWNGSGAWTQLWLTMRALIDALSRDGRHREAAVLLGAHATSRRSPSVFGADAGRLDAAVAAARRGLGAEFDAAWSEGVALDDQRAVTLAIDLAGAASRALVGPSPPVVPAASMTVSVPLWSRGTVRILISTWPAHGHLLPMLPLARAAQRAGHDVVVASGAEMAVEARRRGFEAWDVGPSRAEADAAFGALVPDITVIDPAERVPTIIAGIFGAAALRRAEELVPRAMAWRPDLVVHPITELAGAVAAERSGAARLVHGFGPLPAEAWSWFGARFDQLCEAWSVPSLIDGILDSPFVELCPPSLQRDAVAAFRRRVPMRPGAGDIMPGEHLPWSADDLAALPYERTVHLTLGTLFHSNTHVFEAALAGLGDLPGQRDRHRRPGRRPGVTGRAAGPRPGHRLRGPRAAPPALLGDHQPGRPGDDPGRPRPWHPPPRAAPGRRSVPQRAGAGGVRRRTGADAAGGDGRSRSVRRRPGSSTRRRSPRRRAACRPSSPPCRRPRWSSPNSWLPRSAADHCRRSAVRRRSRAGWCGCSRCDRRAAPSPPGARAR